MTEQNTTHNEHSCIATDKYGRELAEHGSTIFPIACYETDLAGEHIPWHWHDDFEFMIVESGSATVLTDSEKHTVKAGNGFIINCGTLHSIVGDGSIGGLFRSVVFHPRLLGSTDSIFWQKYLRAFTENKSFSGLMLDTRVGWQKDAAKSIAEVYSALKNANEGYEFVIREQLSHIVFNIWRQLPDLGESSSIKPLRRADRTKTMLSFIHSNFAEDISIRDIATAAMVSESECLRCFHSTINTTPIQYLIEYRIHRAADMLTQSSEKISAVALKCGFQDFSYFTRCFRKIKGCTPKEFRLKARCRCVDTDNS